VGNATINRGVASLERMLHLARRDGKTLAELSLIFQLLTLELPVTLRQIWPCQ
jgi:hypothetical protein